MLSLTQILVSTIVGFVLSAVVVALYARWTRTPISASDIAIVAATVAVSILLWREAGNTPMLNEDPIPLVSPNDVLGPVLTYVCLGLIAGFRPTISRAGWPRLRALLTLLSLIVNVATI